jgi:signal transduction histidine kinase
MNASVAVRHRGVFVLRREVSFGRSMPWLWLNILPTCRQGVSTVPDLLRHLADMLNQPGPLDRLLSHALGLLARHAGARGAVLIPAPMPPPAPVAPLLPGPLVIATGGRPLPDLDWATAPLVSAVLQGTRACWGRVDTVPCCVLPLSSGNRTIGALVLAAPHFLVGMGGQGSLPLPEGWLLGRAAALLTEALLLAGPDMTPVAGDDFHRAQHALLAQRSPQAVLDVALGACLRILGAETGIAWLTWADRNPDPLWVGRNLDPGAENRVSPRLPHVISQLETLATVAVLAPDTPLLTHLGLTGPVVYVPAGSPTSVSGGALLAATLPAGADGLLLRTLLTMADHLAQGLQHQMAGQHLGALQERGRLTRRLHEALANTLFELSVTAQTADALSGSDPGRALSLTERMRLLATSAHTQMRTLTLHLRPEELVEVGLARALETALEAFRVHYGLHVEASLAPLRLPPLQQAALFAIAMEAVQNAVHHAHCRRVQVTLTGQPGWVALSVADDGRGFDTLAADGPGLRAMRERCRRLGGQFLLESSPVGGTHLRVELPW